MLRINKAAVLATAMLCLGVFTHTSARADDPCARLLEMPLPDAHIHAAEYVLTPAPHCKARGLIGGKIGFSIWLPSADQWNGKFLMGGAGGFVREEDNQALRYLGDTVLRRGYVTASSDTGHRGDGLDNSWALNDWEAIVNYGHLGMHRTVTTSKAVIDGFYGSVADKSLFIGCSNGGRQALQAAQRYPEDFDGIIAGAPALDFTGVMAGFLNVVQHMYPNPQDLSAPLVTAADRQLLRDAIESQCDDSDGVSDGILHNPTRCDFDVSSLACAGESASQNASKDANNCLNREKLAAVQAVYAGPQDASGPLHHGYPFGAEDTDANGWGSWFTSGALAANSTSQAPNAAYAFSVGSMRHFVFHDPTWQYDNYDWDSFRSDLAPLAAAVNATNPDLGAFRKRGGKLLMFHGWADVALSAHMSINYLERVYSHDASAQDDVKLFLMPGVLHCFGGEGPSIVDWVQALEDWHHSGDAPAELIATYPEKSGARKLCAWPAEARFNGGNPDTAEAYVCK